MYDFGTELSDKTLRIVEQRLFLRELPKRVSSEKYQYFDYLDYTAEGLRLAFTDDVFYLNLQGALNAGTSILTGYYFYSGNPDYKFKRYDAALPFKLEWGDTQVEIEKKLGEQTWECISSDGSLVVRKWRYVNENLFLTVFLDGVDYKLKFIHAGWQPESRSTRISNNYYDCHSMCQLLGVSLQDEKIVKSFELLDISEFEEPRDDGCLEIDEIASSGLELYFDPVARNFGAQDSTYVFSGFRVVRRGDLGSRGFFGKLLFGLEFSDTPEMLLLKMVSPPIAQDIDEFSGYYVWRLDTFLLHVLFSVQEQRLDRITVIAHGFYESDLLR